MHARYTRSEILAAFDIGAGVKPPTWQSGVWWDENSQSDLFAFTLDKSAGSFSPTTRYRDYAISPELIHWESQSRHVARERHGPPLHQPGRARHERRALRAPEHRRPCVLVPRPRDLRLARRRDARSRSPGACITACPATSSPSSPPRSRDPVLRMDVGLGVPAVRQTTVGSSSRLKEAPAR